MSVGGAVVVESGIVVAGRCTAVVSTAVDPILTLKHLGSVENVRDAIKLRKGVLAKFLLLPQYLPLLPAPPCIWSLRGYCNIHIVLYLLLLYCIIFTLQIIH